MSFQHWQPPPPINFTFSFNKTKRKTHIDMFFNYHRIQYCTRSIPTLPWPKVNKTGAEGRNNWRLSRDWASHPFWCLLDGGERDILRVAQDDDQTAVFERLLDRAAHACCARDLQVCGGHDFGVPGGNSHPRAGERPSETQAARCWDWNLARLAPLNANICTVSFLSRVLEGFNVGR